MEVSWPGDYGEIHTKILKRMQKILCESTVYPYLKPAAAKRIAEARALAVRTGFHVKPIVPLGGYSYAFFPWLGTKAFRTVRKLLLKLKERFKLSAIDYERCYYISFRMENGTPEQLYAALKAEAGEDVIDLLSLAGAGENPIFDKYDEYIPSALLREAYAEDRLEKKIQLD